MNIHVVGGALVVLSFTLVAHGSAQTAFDFSAVGYTVEAPLTEDAGEYLPPRTGRTVELAFRSDEEGEDSNPWRRPIIGGLVGAAAGYIVGWQWDVVGDEPATPVGGSTADYHYRTRGALIGLGLGALGGLLLNLL